MSQIPRSRRKMYMGHSGGDVTGLYERHEVDWWLVQDAATVRAYITGRLMKANLPASPFLDLS
jgi:hypothetical protein